MTLLIAYLLMHHMGVTDGVAYVGVFVLWVFHLSSRN